MDQYTSKVSETWKTRKLRNGHNLEETNKTEQLNATWNPGLDPAAENKHDFKKWVKF